MELSKKIEDFVMSSCRSGDLRDAGQVESGLRADIPAEVGRSERRR